MIYYCKAWIENGKVQCCSQVCTDTCPRFAACVNVIVGVKKSEVR